MNNAEKGMEFSIYTECLNSKAIQHITNMIIRKNRINSFKNIFSKVSNQQFYILFNKYKDSVFFEFT